MSYRVSIVIAHLKQHALPPPCKFETQEEAQARKAQLKPKVLAVKVKLSLSHLRRVFIAVCSWMRPLEFRSQNSGVRIEESVLQEIAGMLPEIEKSYGYFPTF